MRTRVWLPYARTRKKMAESGSKGSKGSLDAVFQKCIVAKIAFMWFLMAENGYNGSQCLFLIGIIRTSIRMSFFLGENMSRTYNMLR